MDKLQILETIHRLTASGELTKQEVLDALSAPPNDSADTSRVSFEQTALLKRHHFDAATIISLIGTGIVFVGVLFLVVQHWQDFTLPVRLLITLGFACACYFASVALSIFRMHAAASFWLYVLSALIFPIGVAVWFDAAGILTTEYGIVLLSGLLLVQHLLYFGFFRTISSIFFNILSFSWFFFAITNYFYFSAGLQVEDFTLYRVLILSLSYLFFGYALATEPYRSVQKFVYRVGLIGLLASVLALGKYAPYQNIGWEVLFPILAALIIMLGIKFRIKEFFILPALGIMAYVSKIGFEYFSDSIGWPLTLIATGFVLVILGVGLVRFRKEYFVSASSAN